MLLAGAVIALLLTERAVSQVVFQPSQNVVVPVQVKDGPSDMGDIFCVRLRMALVQVRE